MRTSRRVHSTGDAARGIGPLGAIALGFLLVLPACRPAEQPSGELPAAPAVMVVAIEQAFEDGRVDEAVDLARELGEAVRSEKAPGDPARIAATRLLIRALLQAEGSLAEAGTLAVEHRRELIEALGPDHAESLLATAVLGRVVEMGGDLESAESLFREVVDRARASKGEAHSVTRTAATQLARIYSATGDDGRRAAVEALLARAAASAGDVPRNLDFESDDPGAFPEGWASEPPGHRSRGTLIVTDDGDCHGGRRCALITGLDGIGQVAGLRSRSILQSFDATPYRGSEIRLRAAVRVAGGAGDRAQLWLRLDRGDGTLASADDVEIGRWIPDDAGAILIGMSVVGSGQAWLDDVSVESVDSSSNDDPAGDGS